MFDLLFHIFFFLFLVRFITFFEVFFVEINSSETVTSYLIVLMITTVLTDYILYDTCYILEPTDVCLSVQKVTELLSKLLIR